ncbi:hypothetical protein N866_08970 [Actinotalea ferrariae CF5-4]|uniref:Asp23/Gls24 family envelope stress response protein n=1 Tax=Actinotalea ferrariae CF5-4 TaxID=948458 RepID=A0A021VQT8_9CELL|nr:hypothetical protein [Actinotalea ferrariae]EYR62390.1 hypothetical protein N866_08970 [Actinotalea ferrariae CF5-4]
MDAIADALGGVPVVRLHQGSAAGTHLPGRRVHGVRVHDAGVEVHVAAVWPATVAEAADAVRAALAPLAPGRVDVTIDDVVLDDDDPRSEGHRPEGPATEVSHA